LDVIEFVRGCPTDEVDQHDPTVERGRSGRTVRRDHVVLDAVAVGVDDEDADTRQRRIAGLLAGHRALLSWISFSAMR
jgi:hypothetical protein